MKGFLNKLYIGAYHLYVKIHYDDEVRESCKAARKWIYEDSFGVRNWGYSRFLALIIGSMHLLFWIDLPIVPFLIFGRNILPYPFKGTNLLIITLALGLLSPFLTKIDEEQIEKDYWIKPVKEQRKAFWLFIGMYVILMIPVILLIQYARKVGGW